MELTPQALHDVEFREARRGGYNTRDVDDFLERVAVGVAQLQDRLREAYHRAEAAEGRLGEMQRQLDDVQRRGPEGPSDADETLRRTLVLAQRTADATIKEAKEEAQQLLAEARDEAARTRASAESEALLDARAEVDQLSSTRDALAKDIDAIEAHLDEQRSRLRSGLDELRQLLDSTTLRADPRPPLTAEPARPSLPTLPERHSNGTLTANGDAPSDRPLGEPAFAEPAFNEPTFNEPAFNEPAFNEPSRPGIGDGSMVAALQELPRREPLESRDPVEASPPPTEPMGFPNVPGVGTPPAPPPSGATGFLPDLRSVFDSPESSPPAPPPPDSSNLDDLPLPIDAPPPPPPPPGLEHLHEVGGIPIEPGSRPSEWGRGVFDTDDDRPEPTRSESSRFGRRG